MRIEKTLGYLQKILNTGYRNQISIPKNVLTKLDMSQKNGIPKANDNMSKTYNKKLTQNIKFKNYSSL